MSIHEEATENAQAHLIADNGPSDNQIPIYDGPAPDVEAGAGVVSAGADVVSAGVGVDSSTAAVGEAPAPEPDGSGALLLKSV